MKQNGSHAQNAHWQTLALVQPSLVAAISDLSLARHDASLYHV